MNHAAHIYEMIGNAHGKELQERLRLLDSINFNKPQPAAPNLSSPDAGAHTDFDVVLIGGGLSLLIAPLLAKANMRVAVLDRNTAAAVHREWNASYQELEVLCTLGLLDTALLNTLITARYDYGICRWHGGGTYRVNNVLDCAVDAAALLRHTRQLAVDASVCMIDHATCTALHGSEHGVTVSFCDIDKTAQTLSCKWVLDGRGAASPYATADILCPTVGGVIEGLEEGDSAHSINPRVGEILVTTEHMVQGYQHIWEAFPQRPKQTTVYLFYYAERRNMQQGALGRLYQRFFEELPHYKHGKSRLVRPTFGFITGWSRLTPAPSADHRRILLMGDAAARHSPLTFCGFGAMLRSLQPLLAHISTASSTSAPSLQQTCIPDAPIHRVTGPLSLLMARAGAAKLPVHRLNQLLDAAFKTLYQMGQGPFAALLQDNMSIKQAIKFLRITSIHDPKVYIDVFKVLGARAVWSWFTGLLR